jgi:hypothetical protein
MGPAVGLSGAMQGKSRSAPRRVGMNEGCMTRVRGGCERKEGLIGTGRKVRGKRKGCRR